VSTELTERDYARFLKDGNRLNMRLIPRAVWVDMVSYAQQQDDIIDIVLGEMYWLWDINDLEAKAASEGRNVTRTELLQEMMAEMGDSDWWKLTAAFEEYILRSYAVDASRWSVFLDSVYDLQEREGWRDRQ
jgi:hypothetical protein